MNINSMKNKITDIAQFILSTHTDILCIGETKLISTDLETQLEIPGFELIRKDRGKNRGGGLAIYYRTGLQVKVPESTIRLKSCEYLEIDISISRRKKAKLIAIYRPPNAKLREFLESFDNNLNALTTKNPSTPIIIMGDLNIDIQPDNTSVEKN